MTRRAGSQGDDNNIFLLDEVVVERKRTKSNEPGSFGTKFSVDLLEYNVSSVLIPQLLDSLVGHSRPIHFICRMDQRLYILGLFNRREDNN